MALLSECFALPKSGPLMALDPGERNWGIAVSDPERMIASPLTVIKNNKFTQKTNALFSLYHQRNCTGLIIGLPLNMNASFGRRVQSVKTLASNLLKFEDIPIAFFDERLSSQAAERSLLEADLSRKRRAKLIDKIAASLILQTVLDQLGTLKTL